MNIFFLCLILFEYVLVLKYPDPQVQVTTGTKTKKKKMLFRSGLGVRRRRKSAKIVDMNFGLPGFPGIKDEKAHFGFRPDPEKLGDTSISKCNASLHFIDRKARVVIPSLYVFTVFVIFSTICIICY